MNFTLYQAPCETTRKVKSVYTFRIVTSLYVCGEFKVYLIRCGEFALKFKTISKIIFPPYQTLKISSKPRACVLIENKLLIIPLFVTK